MADLLQRVKRPEVFFLVCAAMFGMLMVILVPPMQSYDEQVHFFRAYQLSDFNLLPDMVSAGSSTQSPVAPGGNLPVNVLGFGYTFLYSIRLAPQTHNKLAVFKHDVSTYKGVRINAKDTQAAYFPNAGVYSPVVYAPQIAAIWLGKLVNAPILWFYYLGRVFSLLVWIALVYLAIKFLPVGKWLLVVTALLPLSLFQAASFSADTMTNGLAFLTVGLFMNFCLRKDEVISNRDIAVAVLATSALSLCKSGFWPFALLFWLVPIVRFGTKKRYVLANALISGASTAVFVAWFAMVKYIVPYIPLVTNPGQPINYQSQLSYVIHSPLQFMGVLFHQYFNGQMVGVFKYGVGILGWGEAPIAGFGFILIAAGLIFAIVLLALEKTNPRYGIIQRLGALGVLLALVGMMSVSLYTTSTPLHQGSIAGLQGRYFIPYLSLLIAVFAGLAIKYRDKLAPLKRATLLLPISTFIVLCLAVRAVLLRYYF